MKAYALFFTGLALVALVFLLPPMLALIHAAQALNAGTQ